MEELFNLGISNNTIKNMLELVPNIKEMSNKDIIDKINILKNINCSDYQITNIISSNPMYLDRTNEEILKLLEKLNDLGFNTLNILFDANPYILNLEPYEIDNYIKNRLEKNEKLEDIIDDMDSNPYLLMNYNKIKE